MMRLVFVFFIILFSASSYAKKPYQYQQPIWSMGMGGVYTPFPREVDMPTANAAYLSHVKSINIEILNLGLGAPGLGAIQEVQELPPMDDMSDINNYMGRTIWTGLEGRASFVGPHFGFSIFDNFYLRSYFTNPLMPEWYLDFINDDGMTMAGAVSLGPEVSFGFAAKKITRWGGENEIGFDILDQYLTTHDTDVILDQFQDKGIGYGMDVSLLYKPEGSSLPIVTLVWKDVGYTTFQKTSGSKSPPHIDDNLTLGVGYEFDGPGIDGKVGFEYRNIRTINMQLGEKLHMGAELSLPLFDVRFGSSQGYATYGLGIDLWAFRLDIAQYTVEQGYYPGQTPDQRMQMGLTLDLSMDADFNIMGKDGRKRKLKERR